jgi:uncharacterized protein
MLPKVLIVPGLGSSGPQHWQTLWEQQLPGCERVQQRDFDNAVCSEWIANIDAAVRREGENVVLVGHSCGSLAIAHWARKYQRKIVGAFIVAPSDVEMPGFPYHPVGFAPIPLERLPFRSVVVASSEDEYAPLERSQQFAKAWGSEFIDIGPAGHINAASGYGPWTEGLEILTEFLHRISKEQANGITA